MNQTARQIALPAIYNPNNTIPDDLRDINVDSTIVHQDDEGQEGTIYLLRHQHTINNGRMFNGFLDLNYGTQPSFAVKGIFAIQYDANNAHHDVDNEIVIRNHILQEEGTLQVALDHGVILPQCLLSNRSQGNIPNDQRYYFIVSPWADGGDVYDSLDDPFNESRCRNTFRQMFRIVNYLHSHGVFHRDLKPENFVLNGEDEDVYVIDFGKSRICDTDLIENDNEHYGTTEFTPPELNGAPINGDPNPLIDWKKADVWALGVSLYIMLIGDNPPWLNGVNGEEVNRENEWFQYICRNRHLASVNFQGGNLSSEVINLLQSMLLEDPADRISIADILRHDWFNEQ